MRSIWQTGIAAAAVALQLLSAMPAAASVKGYRQANEHAILTELAGLLAIPNVASDRENIRRNADALVAMMEKRGLKPRLLESSDAKAPPVVYGEWRVAGAKRTIVLYAHYDGQPTDASQWTGSHPWKPVLRDKPLYAGGTVIPMPQPGEKIDPESRLYARSASDDKAGVMAILAAIDALKAEGRAPAANIKIVFEGEEEAGSPHLADILGRHKALLKSDGWVIFDGPAHQSGRVQVVFGARGIIGADITVYGANRPLHSGHYGNWAPNPAMELSRLLASMKDETGRVLIKGFYDDVEPLGEAERRAIAEAPQVDRELQAALGFGQPEGGGQSLLALISQPSLNIDGSKSAEVGGKARNIIPTTATATLDMRLVRGNDYRRQFDKLVAHVRAQGFYVTDREPTAEERARYPRVAQVALRDGYNAERADMDDPFARAVTDAVRHAGIGPIVNLPSMGGSLPLYVIRNTFDVPSIMVGIANHDNNQHAEDENLRLQNLWDGIEAAAGIMTMTF
ncbi:M20/M25/M40 family metallo-hydrolase [Pedomonas mirosovicensis]|uniref:M20/M25/M40 family metallo-hydrolase n=1 Tax=Pedomonas mirosovicensis TaxID=2908641 RepID=UPI002166CFE0|nr:M20/M25/M40 family metallo-hydrolase [Pedomonas mirosovicensis]MCH8686564.1 M20/M25/M40 family metallo-hydrolase [Pedomonas mirosovicensis]